MRAIAIMALLACACGGATLARREPDEYIGCATDENWPLFDEAQVIVDVAQAPLVLTPGNGASVPVTPVDIVWQPTPTIAGEVDGDSPMTCPQWSEGFSTLHLPPVTGTVFDLQITSGGEVRHRALTTLQKWTASEDTWKKLAGSTVEVQVHRILVEGGVRTAGPYAPIAPWKLTIAK